jgi:hypothetical protein
MCNYFYTKCGVQEHRRIEVEIHYNGNFSWEASINQALHADKTIDGVAFFVFH